MSSQGGASNKNGKDFEDEIALLLSDNSIEHRRRVRMPGPCPSGHVVDFWLLAQDILVECKSLGGQPGTIWQKIPYAVDTLSLHGKPNPILLLGGAVPSNWVWTYLFDFGVRRGVRVMAVDTFKAFLNVED